MDGIDLGHDAEITLAVALRAHHADRGLMDQRRVGAKHLGHADGLGRPARMMVDQHNL